MQLRKHLPFFLDELEKIAISRGLSDAALTARKALSVAFTAKADASRSAAKAAFGSGFKGVGQKSLEETARHSSEAAKHQRKLYTHQALRKIKFAVD